MKDLTIEEKVQALALLEESMEKLRQLCQLLGCTDEQGIVNTEFDNVYCNTWWQLWMERNNRQRKLALITPVNKENC